MRLRTFNAGMMLLSFACCAAQSPLAADAPQVVKTITAHADPSFEVATIRLNPTDGGWRLQPTLDGYTGLRVTLLYLIEEAYGLYDEQRISAGPAWLKSSKFDLEAKIDVAEVPDYKKLALGRRRAMLRQLLAERFGLKLHHESKDFEAYALVPAKGGAKLVESKPAAVEEASVQGINCHVTKSARGYLKLEGCSMTALAGILRIPVQRTVVDRSGLIGRYDFELHWRPEDSPDMDGDWPSVFTALTEQLGLRLQPAKVPMDTIVIDAAEMPSGN